jgi:hypothetical protein
MASERELSLLFRSHEHLLAGIAATSDQERSRQNHMALLTAPLHGLPAENEYLVKLNRVYDSVVGGKNAVMRQSDFKLTNNSPLIDLQPGHIFVDKGFVTPDGFVCDGNSLYLDDVQFVLPDWRNGNGHPWFHRHLPFRAYDPSDETCYVKQPDNSINSTAVAFNCSNSHINFGHFIHDFILQYPIYQDIRESTDTPMCLFGHRFKYSIQNYIVEKLFHSEISSNRVQYIDSRSASYSGVYVPYPQFSPVEGEIGFSSAKRAQNILRDMAQEFRAAGSGTSSTRAKRIFVSRRDAVSNAYGRSDLNHDSIENIFGRHGFAIVTLSGKSPEEIFDIFADAQAVAGVHGAGLMNIAFSSAAKPLLIELDSTTKTWRSIERFVRALGFRHALLTPQKTASGLEYPDLHATIECLL